MTAFSWEARLVAAYVLVAVVTWAAGGGLLFALPRAARLLLLARALAYGCVGVACDGWYARVFAEPSRPTLSGATGASALQSTVALLFVYAYGALLLITTRARLRRLPAVFRVLPLVAVIYAWEFAAGLMLRLVAGACPWDYSGAPCNVAGLVEIGHLPAWVACAYLFEFLEWAYEIPHPNPP